MPRGEGREGQGAGGVERGRGLSSGVEGEHLLDSSLRGREGGRSLEDPHSSAETAIEGLLAGSGNRLVWEGASIPIRRGWHRGAEVADGLEGIPHEGCPLACLVEQEAVEDNLANHAGRLFRGGSTRGRTRVT